mgnify:CR=1 FL=1
MGRYKDSSIISIDVCVASYNGCKYIEAQFDSIFSQTVSVDRIIVSDDASTDETISLLKGMVRSDMTIISNMENIRHVRNFERALLQSTSDFIFLSDQDDLWLPNKIERVMSVFYDNPDVSIVHHNISTVDVDGRLLQKSYLPLEPGVQSPAGFVLQEFIRPRLFGCAMAIRRSVLDILLPFPSCVYAHDHWIALASACAGKVYFLDEDLILYRQHDNNLTPKFRRPFPVIISSRFSFIKMVIYAFLRGLSIRKVK